MDDNDNKHLSQIKYSDHQKTILIWKWIWKGLFKLNQAEAIIENKMHVCYNMNAIEI